MRRCDRPGACIGKLYQLLGELLLHVRLQLGPLHGPGEVVELLGVVLQVVQLAQPVTGARAAVARVRGRYDGSLDIATTPTLAVHPLTAILGRFSALYPGVRVRITDCDVPGGATAVVGGGECEIGVVRLPLSGVGLRTTTLGRQTFFLVLPPGSASPGDEPVELSVLGDLPLITTPPGSSSRTGLDEALAMAGVTQPHIAVETIYRVTIASLVVAGVGAAYLPEYLADEAQALGARKVATRPAVSREVVIVHRDGPLSPAAQALVDLAVEMAPFTGSAPSVTTMRAGSG